MKERERHARRVQESIRLVLLRDWDPIGVRDEPAAQDEYDAYVGGVYRLLASGATAEEIADHLWLIEKEKIGMACKDSSMLLPVARKLRTLDVRL